VVVLDLEMPFLNGMEVTRELRNLTPGPGVVICSVESDEEIVEAAQQAGPLGYVFKTHMTKDLIEAVSPPLAVSLSFPPSDLTFSFGRRRLSLA
jgi:DNA-binding NarL/FixJ family response regulator